MSAIAVYAGSFCPFTKGHEDIVRKSLPLFDRLIIAIGHNYNKKDLFSVEQRMDWIWQLYKNEPKVAVEAYQGLTVDLCRKVHAQYLVRGIRGAADVDYEQTVAWNNKVLCPEIETVFLLSAQEHLAVSSSVVRELLKAGIAKDEEGHKLLAKYVPEAVVPMVVEKCR